MSFPEDQISEDPSAEIDFGPQIPSSFLCLLFVQHRALPMASNDKSLAATAASTRIPSAQLQAVESDSSSASHSLGKPSQKETITIADTSVLLVSWICFAVAVIAITPRFNFAWSLRLKYQLQLIGLLLSIMNLCLSTLRPKLCFMVESLRSKPRLQNFNAILQNSIIVLHAHTAWRALLLTLIVLPIALSLAYKEFIGGSSTREFRNHTNLYGLTAAPGLASNATLKFGPSYMTNATLPFLTTSLPFITTSPATSPQFPQTYGFNHLVINSTSSAFLDVRLPEQFLSLQQALQKDTTSDFTLTADVHATIATYNNSIENSRDNDTFWDYYLQQRGKNSTPDSFSSVIDKADLCSGKALCMLTGNDMIDASWIILSFVNYNDSSKSLFNFNDLSNSADL